MGDGTDTGGCATGGPGRRCVPLRQYLQRQALPPDGRELKHYASGTILQDGGGPKELGAQLCRDRFVEHFRIENPETVRIHQVSGGQSDIIAYGASRQTTARTFQVEVMVRNAYGVFLGPEIYRCHTTDDGRRLLRYAR